MILHVADLHTDVKWFQWLVDISHLYSLVCLAGDALDLNPYRSHVGQLEKVLPFLRAIDAPLAVVSGNHDSLAGAGPRLEHAAWLQEIRGNAVFVDGDSFDFEGGFRFRCLGWQAPLPIAGPNEIWIHHAPPSLAKTAIPRAGCDFGDFDLGEHLNARLAPFAVLCGHVHEPVRHADRSCGCWSLNPGHPGGSPRPNYFEIDLAAGIATHHRASGESTIFRLWLPGRLPST
jgi:predicted phosphodiesterase